MTKQTSPTRYKMVDWEDSYVYLRGKVAIYVNRDGERRSSMFWDRSGIESAVERGELVEMKG